MVPVLILFNVADPRVQTINLSPAVDHVPAEVLADSVGRDPAGVAAFGERGNPGTVPPQAAE